MAAALLEWLTLETGADSGNFDGVADLAGRLLGRDKAASWAELGQALAAVRPDAADVLDDAIKEEPEVSSMLLFARISHF
jgi:hypothetical protein